MSAPQCSLWCKGRRCPGDAKFVVGVKFSCCTGQVRHKGVCIWHMYEFHQNYHCQECKGLTVVSEPIELERYMAARRRLEPAS